MPSDRSLVEREMQRLELFPFTLEGFHRARERKQRNRRIRAGVVALVVAAAGTGALVRAFPSGLVPADDPRSPFLGSWVSTDEDGSTQTMTIRAPGKGALDIALHDDSSSLCSDRQTRVDGVDTPSTMTGTGRLENATTLVVPSPVLACVDGQDPTLTWSYREEGGTRWGTSYTLVLDPDTDRLFDNLAVAWHRGVTPENGSNATAENSEEAGPGTYSFLGGEVTFQTSPPWSDHPEAYIDPRLFFLVGRDDAWIEILANAVLPEATCADDGGVPASAEELVQHIRSNPDLVATEPVVERVGGVDAFRLDVRAVAGAAKCSPGESVPVVSVSGRSETWGVVDPGDRGRLYVLDLPGGSARALAIWIASPEAAFERAVETAGPVLDSFEFHMRERG